MPEVDGKHYAYTKGGIAAAEKAKKESGFKMRGFSGFGNPPAKQKIDFKKTTNYSQKAIDERKQSAQDEKHITREHNVTAEKEGYTGETCMTCGEDIWGHPKTHKFKKRKK